MKIAIFINDGYNRKMQYTSFCDTPLGKILMACDEQGLCGLWFFGQKYYAAGLDKNSCERDCEIFEQTRLWLKIYFSGKNPGFTPPLHLTGTDFRKAVWKILLDIPYGETLTYSKIAGMLSVQKGLSKMSSQAVGGAVGHNPISVIVPCHRVLGSGKSLTGYAGGLQKKIFLLNLEGAAFAQL